MALALQRVLFGNLTYVAMENGPFIVDLPIIHSYVKLPEAVEHCTHMSDWGSHAQQICAFFKGWYVHGACDLPDGFWEATFIGKHVMVMIQVIQVNNMNDVKIL